MGYYRILSFCKKQKLIDSGMESEIAKIFLEKTYLQCSIDLFEAMLCNYDIRTD